MGAAAPYYKKLQFFFILLSPELFCNVNSIFTQQLTRVSHVQPRARTDVGNQTNSIELKNIYVCTIETTIDRKTT